MANRQQCWVKPLNAGQYLVEQIGGRWSVWQRPLRQPVLLVQDLDYLDGNLPEAQRGPARQAVYEACQREA